VIAPAQLARAAGQLGCWVLARREMRLRLLAIRHPPSAIRYPLSAIRYPLPNKPD